MFATDIRNGTGASGYDLPPQQISTKKKDKEWLKKTLDTLENIGIRYISHHFDQYNDVERIIKGNYKYKDVTKSSMFLSQLDYFRSQADLKYEITHYPFIEPIINQLVMDYIKKPNPLIIQAEDELSMNDYITKQTEMLWTAAQNTIEQRIKKKAAEAGLDLELQDFESEEEQQAHQEQVGQFFDENTPDEIKKYIGTSFKPNYIDWAEKTLKESEIRFYFEEKFTELLTHYFTYGKCFMHHRVGFDFFEPEVWHPRNTFTSATDRNRHVELGDYIGHIDYYTPNTVIQRWGSKLTAKQKQQITRSTYHGKNGIAHNVRHGQSNLSIERWAQQGGGQLEMLPHKDYYAYENARFVQDHLGLDLGVSDWFGEPMSNSNFLQDPAELRSDLIRVMETYWVSYQKVGYLTMLDEESGEIITDLITDDILEDYLKERGIKKVQTVSLEEHIQDPQPDTLVWDYVEEVRYGIKIAKENTDLPKDLYIDGEALEYQLQGESDIYQTRLPVTGIVTDLSLAARMTPYQIDYTMALNMAKDYASKELGVFFLFDMAYLPTYLKEGNEGEQLSELYEVVRELGMLPIDSSSPQAQRSKFNQFTQINNDLTQVIMGKINYAISQKRMALEVIGLAPERAGMPTEQKTATGINIANNASFSQTEMWYVDFNAFQNRTFEIHLNVAQYAKQNDKDNTVFFADSDRYQHLLKITDPYLTLRKLRVYAQNNGNRKSDLETLKQFFLSDNTIPKDLEIISEVMFSDSISKIKQLSRLKRKEAELIQEQQQQADLQQMEKEKADKIELSEIEHRQKMEQIALKGKIDLNRQEILALGFDEEKDRNNNQIADVVERSKIALEELKAYSDTSIREQQNEILRLQSESNKELQERKLDIEQQKVDTERYKADKQVEIARENKTQHELKYLKDKKQK